MKIVISCPFPPIPTSAFDWCAYIEGMEEDTRLYGYGPSPKDALQELMNRLDKFKEWPK